MPVITTTSNKRFDALDGETLLDAALRQGVLLEYSCRTGRCSTCKAQVTAGSTLALQEESGLDRIEQDAGWILTCVRTACSDVTLDAADMGDVRVFGAKTLPCRIHALDQLSADVMKVVLRLPPNVQFEYLAGQYIDVIANGGLRRSYSIANAPREDKSIELHIREVPGGVMSEYWFSRARANDLLRLNGPLGTFFLRDVESVDLILLATGTGMAPVKAMLESLARTPPGRRPRSVSVYWGGRTPEDLYWDSSVVGIEHRFVPTLSRAATQWQGARGYVQEVALSHSPDLSRAVVHACGSDAMIRDARAQFVTGGLAPRHFHSDAFVCSAAP
jgi:CDP-4-dehydro-6-deoxyglucose reductase